MKFILLLLNLISLFFAPVMASGYTMRDLEALEAQKSYREFLAHAMDIRPSERGPQWVSMVADMATGLIDFKMERLDFNNASFQEIEKLALWPTLQNDEFFQTKRANFLRRYLGPCLKSSEKQKCASDIMLYWNNSPKDIDLGIELAQLSEQNSLGLDSWTFLAKAPRSPLAHIFCQRPIVQKAVIKELTKPSLIGRVSLAQLKEQISSTVHDTCWSKIQPLLEEELMVITSSQLKREAIYRVLKAKNALDQDQEDFFLVSYLLQGPVVGETFNLAWSRVRELAEDYPRRQRVYQRLTELSLLPDTLFASANAQSRDVIMGHLDQFFPEYFPHYAKTCLNYRQGIGQYPLGNPTLHCADFFRISENKKWVEQSLKIQYSGQKK